MCLWLRGGIRLWVEGSFDANSHAEANPVYRQIGRTEAKPKAKPTTNAKKPKATKSKASVAAEGRGRGRRVSDAASALGEDEQLSSALRLLERDRDTQPRAQPVGARAPTPASLIIPYLGDGRELGRRCVAAARC